MLALGLGLPMIKLIDPDSVSASLLGTVLSVLIRTAESDPEARKLLADPDCPARREPDTLRYPWPDSACGLRDLSCRAWPTARLCTATSESLVRRSLSGKGKRRVCVRPGAVPGPSFPGAKRSAIVHHSNGGQGADVCRGRS